jgi:hypothetical protein
MGAVNIDFPQEQTVCCRLLKAGEGWLHDIGADPLSQRHRAHMGQRE